MLFSMGHQTFLRLGISVNNLCSPFFRLISLLNSLSLDPALRSLNMVVTIDKPQWYHRSLWPPQISG